MSKMVLELVAAGPERAGALLQLSELYAYDFSEIRDLDLDDIVRFGAARLVQRFVVAP